MPPRIVGQLRMDRRDEDPSLAREHRVPVALGENSDARPRLGDPRGADEDRSEGLFLALDLAEEKQVNKRVTAVLLFLRDA